MTLRYKDLHVHTHHSKDNYDETATMENLAGWGHDGGVAVGFADHMDVRHFVREDCCFREENMGAYLEEFDTVRSIFPETTLGVELEWYPDDPELMRRTQEWLDRHRKDLDRVLGSSHYVYTDYAVTWHVHMRQLVGVHTFSEILEEYLRGETAMVEAGVADFLAHADVIFRGHHGVFEVSPEERQRGEEGVLELCRRAMARGMAIEVNLLGMIDASHPDPSPSWRMSETVAREGATMYVASDAHNSRGFRHGLELIPQVYERLSRAGAKLL